MKTLLAILSLLAVVLVMPAMAGKKGKGPAGEVNTPPAPGERIQDTIKVGDTAPDFTLPRLKEAGAVKLSSYQGQKPVVLIFGSYT